MPHNWFKWLYYIPYLYGLSYLSTNLVLSELFTSSSINVSFCIKASSTARLTGSPYCRYFLYICPVVRTKITRVGQHVSFTITKVACSKLAFKRSIARLNLYLSRQNSFSKFSGKNATSLPCSTSMSFHSFFYGAILFPSSPPFSQATLPCPSSMSKGKLSYLKKKSKMELYLNPLPAPNVYSSHFPVVRDNNTSPAAFFKLPLSHINFRAIFSVFPCQFTNAVLHPFYAFAMHTKCLLPTVQTVFWLEIGADHLS